MSVFVKFDLNEVLGAADVAPQSVNRGQRPPHPLPKNEGMLAVSLNVARTPSYKSLITSGKLNTVNFRNSAKSSHIATNIFYIDDAKSYWLQNTDFYRTNTGDPEYFRTLVDAKANLDEILGETLSNLIPPDSLNEIATAFREVSILDSMRELDERTTIDMAGQSDESLLALRMAVSMLLFQKGGRAKSASLSSVRVDGRSGEGEYANGVLFHIRDYPKEDDPGNSAFLNTEDFTRVGEQVERLKSYGSLKILSKYPHKTLLDQMELTDGFVDSLQKLEDEPLEDRHAKVEELCEIAMVDFAEFNNRVSDIYGFKFRVDDNALEDKYKEIYCEILRIFVDMPKLLQHPEIYSILKIDPTIKYSGAFDRNGVFGKNALEALLKGREELEKYVIHECAHLYKKRDDDRKMAGRQHRGIQKWLSEKMTWRSFDLFVDSQFREFIEEVYSQSTLAGNDARFEQEFLVKNKALLLLALGEGQTFSKYGLEDESGSRGQLSREHLSRWIDTIILQWRSNTNLFRGIDLSDKSDFVIQNKDALIERLLMLYDMNTFGSHPNGGNMDDLLESQKLILSSQDKWYDKTATWYPRRADKIRYTINFGYQTVIGCNTSVARSTSDVYCYASPEEYFAEASADYVQLISNRPSDQDLSESVVADQFVITEIKSFYT